MKPITFLKRTSLLIMLFLSVQSLASSSDMRVADLNIMSYGIITEMIPMTALGAQIEFQNSLSVPAKRGDWDRLVEVYKTENCSINVLYVNQEATQISESDNYSIYKIEFGQILHIRAYNDFHKPSHLEIYCSHFSHSGTVKDLETQLNGVIKIK